MPELEWLVSVKMEVRRVETIVKALNDAEVKYLVVGGLAVVAHGYERLTVNVDLVIGLQHDNITRGLCALYSAGWSMTIPVTPDQFAILSSENPGGGKKISLRCECGAMLTAAPRSTYSFTSHLILKRNSRERSGK
ncbi:MAG TPA: hypothetical protein VN873_16425 [Candidatus Angelobacter sp.]|nr:hypothetical protein [Candidatus Angelobacter sp.]